MKGKQLILVLGLLVVLGGAALFLRQRDSATWSQSAVASSDKVLDFPLNDVSQVTLKTGETELNLVKKENTWRVVERADYPADFQKVASLIRKLWELRAAQTVEVGESQLGRLDLTDTAATSIQLQGESDKKLAALLLGKKQMREAAGNLGRGEFPVGRYVMTPARAGQVFLAAQTFDEVETKPESWLNRDFIKVENPKSISLIATTPATKWQLTRENATADWTLAETKSGEELDATESQQRDQRAGQSDVH